MHQRDNRRVGGDSISSGWATTISSALGTRSRVASPDPRVDDDGVPAERLGERAQRLGDVAGADRDQPERRPYCFGEDGAAVLLEEPGARGKSSSQRSPTPSPSTTTYLVPRSSGVVESSNRSTKTSISPPQGSPTVQACSSAIPYETTAGSAPAMTALACSATSASTQPPETEPNSAHRR